MIFGVAGIPCVLGGLGRHRFAFVTFGHTVSYALDTQVRALCYFTGPKRAFSVAMAPENSIHGRESGKSYT
jgi:hypothetical protein